MRPVYRFSYFIYVIVLGVVFVFVLLAGVVSVVSWFEAVGKLIGMGNSVGCLWVVPSNGSSVYGGYDVVDELGNMTCSEYVSSMSIGTISMSILAIIASLIIAWLALTETRASLYDLFDFISYIDDVVRRKEVNKEEFKDAMVLHKRIPLKIAVVAGYVLVFVLFSFMALSSSVVYSSVLVLADKVYGLGMSNVVNTIMFLANYVNPWMKVVLALTIYVLVISLLKWFMHGSELKKISIIKE